MDKRLNSFCALTCVLAVASVASVAKTRAEPLATAGIGLASCAKLAQDMKPADGLNNIVNALIFYWAQGYMSAANITTLEADSEHIDLAKFDETVLIPKIHAFCSQNPDRKPISVLDELLETTEKVQGKWRKGSIGWAAE
jgi:hypothetical protein